MADETYNGWTNRETWAVALHINNDQGWQESVSEALRAALNGFASDFEVETPGSLTLTEAGEIIKNNVEERLDVEQYAEADALGLYRMHIAPVVQDIGELWRVNWDELGASFLRGLAGQEQDA